MASNGDQHGTTPSPEWRRYGAALSLSMAEVRDDAPEEVHPLLMEAAEYWLALGLLIGLNHAGAARRLLDVIEQDGAERDELAADASRFVEDALA